MLLLMSSPDVETLYGHSQGAPNQLSAGAVAPVHPRVREQIILVSQDQHIRDVPARKQCKFPDALLPLSIRFRSALSYISVDFASQGRHANQPAISRSSYRRYCWKDGPLTSLMGRFSSANLSIPSYLKIRGQTDLPSQDRQTGDVAARSGFLSSSCH